MVNRAGQLNSYEKRMLKSGIMFRSIKQAEFGLRDDELDERKHYIVTG